jgi:NADH-quinone oxidoreductase subunit M
MILVWMIAIPTLGGLLAWLVGRRHADGPRWVALAALAIDLIPAVMLATRSVAGDFALPGGPWLVSFDLPWVPALGIRFFLAADGLSLVLVLMTVFLGIMAVVSAWNEIQQRTGFFYFNLLWVLAGITGVFLALDLFLFYFFWEMMLVPMYLIIAIWGHENRVYAAIKFFLFTQISGLFMLVAILGLYFVHGNATGLYTFNYLHLLGTPLSPAPARWLMLGFLAAFAVKLPVVPLHTWLPDAHTEAPTAGSVILAGLMLKTGAYGLLRFVVPLFPAEALDFAAPLAMGLAVVSILYGALLAFAQTDLKRLVAYTSVSHMGFVLLGIFAWNRLALQGVVMQTVCHAITTGALFMLVGALQERLHTRDLSRMGGLWSPVPRMAAVTMVFALASLGLPGLGNFIGEFLVLVGTYRSSVAAACLASLGLIGASVYALWVMQRAFHGPTKLGGWKPADLGGREMAAMAAMIVMIVWLGLYPQPVFDTARLPLQHLQQVTAQAPVSTPVAVIRPVGARDPFQVTSAAHGKGRP